MAYCLEGNYDAAIVDFDRAIQYSSEDTQGILSEMSSDNTGNRPDFIAEYWRLSQFEADLPSVYTMRAAAYYGKGEYDLAIADLERALELGPDPSVRQRVEALLGELRSSPVK